MICGHSLRLPIYPRALSKSCLYPWRFNPLENTQFLWSALDVGLLRIDLAPWTDAAFTFAHETALKY